MTAPSGVPVDALRRHLPLIESSLRAAVGDGPGPLDVAARYVMGWEDADGSPAVSGGKRIRPALCLLAAEAVGADPLDAVPGAVAVELVHNFSLVHDEIQDHDAERHGRPTAWALLGEGQAINVGDYLYTRAIGALVDAGRPAPERRLAALRVLNTAIDRMIGGQWLDISFESRNDVRVDEYLAMVAGKTGALLGAPLEMGALLAGAPARDATLLGDWGVEVGLAFQAQDDYLGIWGDPDLTGKTNTGDIERRKKSLPIIHGLNDPDAAGLIRRAFAQPPSVDSTRVVVAALEAAGADELCHAEARSHLANADRMLAETTIAVARKEELRAVGAYVVARSS